MCCGQAGHWAKNCPGSPDKKRRVDGTSKEDTKIMMVETYALDEHDGMVLDVGVEERRSPQGVAGVLLEVHKG